MSYLLRAVIVALLSACLIGESTPTPSLAASAVRIPVVYGTKTFPSRKVNLQALPVRPPPAKAIRRDYPHVKALVKAPESPRLPPYRIRHDADPLSMKLFRKRDSVSTLRAVGGARIREAPPAHGPDLVAARGPEVPGARHTASVIGSGPGSIGNYPWWTFESHSAFESMGHALVNVANGNLLLGATDIAIPHFGLDLLVSRAYNSLSQYDVNGTDGSQPSVFGNAWTTNLDAHIALNGTGGVAIYDGMGTRWDYNPDGNGGWIRPTGNYSSLWYSASNQEYYWTFKDGQVYQFRSPMCSQPAVCGRIHYIYARNNNEYLHFTYGFSSDWS